MIYIIDANNLAGKLDLLGEDDFDRILIELIKDYKPNKKYLFILVFDSADQMGDKKKIDDRLTVIYTPKDSYYKNADDKILEIAENIFTENKNKSFALHLKQSEVFVVTDDLEIKEKIENLNREKNLEIKLEGSSRFTIRLKDFFDQEEIDNDDKLSEDEEDDINKEFFKIWK